MKGDSLSQDTTPPRRVWILIVTVLSVLVIWLSFYIRMHIHKWVHLRYSYFLTCALLLYHGAASSVTILKILQISFQSKDKCMASISFSTEWLSGFDNFLV